MSTKVKPTKSSRNSGKPVLAVGLLKQIFEAAGFQFIKHQPVGRLVFYSPMDERDIQFWYKNRLQIDDKDTLQKAMDLICQLAYDRGENWGKHTVRTEIKKSLGLS